MKKHPSLFILIAILLTLTISLLYSTVLAAQAKPIFRVTAAAAPETPTRKQPLIAPVTANELPQLILNEGVTVTANMSATISNSALLATDADTPAIGISYTLAITPLNGDVWLSGSPLLPGMTFSQADIDTAAVSYQHNGNTAITDTFNFEVANSPITTSRASVDTLGNEGNGQSDYPSISADGRYVAFTSGASNLVAGDTNGTTDIFVYDTQTGAISRVSVDSLGNEGNSQSAYASISANGRYVAFHSYANNLVTGDTNATADIFVHDTQTGSTKRVSVDTLGTQGNSLSSYASISADGNYVAFYSLASNLVTGDTNGAYDIFVHDAQTKSTSRVSVDSLGTQGNNQSYDPSLSADGRFVAFESSATNLVAGDTNGHRDIFVHDTQTGSTKRVSVDSLDTQGNNQSYDPSLSADGRYVAFESSATNLVTGDTNGDSDIFVHDTQTGSTSRVSVDSLGTQGNSDSYKTSLSADGRYVAFHSYASNLVAGDTNGAYDGFVHDRQTGRTSRVSLDSFGTQANNHSSEPILSADGHYVAFWSFANNLVDGDTNGFTDIFVRPNSIQDTFSITLLQPPVAVTNLYTTTHDMPLSGHIILDDTGDGVDYDLNGDPLSIYTYTLPSTGSLALNLDGSFIYTPTVNFYHIVTFAYQISDTLLVSNWATVTLTITSDNLPQLILNQGVTVTANMSTTISNLALLATDIDTPAAGISYTLAMTPTTGDLWLNGIPLFPGMAFSQADIDAGTLSYQHNGNTTITDTFDFAVANVPLTTHRASIDSLGNEGNFPSYESSLSANGRYLAFRSSATNLVSDDTNGVISDIFVHDTQTGNISRVSLDSLGNEGNAASYAPSLSADGRYIAFWSDATNLVANDTNGVSDIFVHDRQTGSTRRVSLDSLGTQGNNASYEPSLSADGRYVAFHSWATNLVGGDTNVRHDIFVHDTQTGSTHRVSLDSFGNQGNGHSYDASLSADGRYVAFWSDANNLVANDTNGTSDVFVHDTQTGSTSRVSVDSFGTQGNNTSYRSTISADSRYVAFQSYASNLVPGDTNWAWDIFVHDRQTGNTSRVSVDSFGTQGNDVSHTLPSISADGRYVVFVSYANNLVTGDTNETYDIFVHDRQTGSTNRVSIDSFGTQGNDVSSEPNISADGRYIAFRSKASNLVAGDTNGDTDVFVRLNSVQDTFSIAILQPPVAVTNLYTTAEDISLAGHIILDDTGEGVDYDLNGDPLSLDAYTSPMTGSLALDLDGSFIYTPTVNFNGVVTFAYQISDTLLLSNWALVTMTVTPVNDPPIALTDVYTMEEGLLLSVPSVTGILANDSDPVENDPFTAVLATPPITGTLILTDDGAFDFKPPLGFTGIITFEYYANDGDNSDLTLVTIHVTPTTCTTPPNATDITIGYAGSDATFSWAPFADSYEIYRSASPYFTVTGAPYDVTPTATYTDVGVIGPARESWYYQVIGVNGCGTKSSGSNETAVFEFDLLPGS